MKTKILVLVLAAIPLALTAWLVRAPNPVQADEIPEKYRDTVHKGLEYLAKQQAKDGHWEGDDGKHPVAMTGLAGLALLMEKDNPNSRNTRSGRLVMVKPKYAANISKAADWLIEQSQTKRDGLIFSEHASETTRYMQGHGLATLFLAGAFSNEHDDVRARKLQDVLTRAVKYIVKAQSTQGGWYDTSKVEGHDFATIEATVIQLQALQAAEIVGIPVPKETTNGARDYLVKAIAKYEAETKPAKDGARYAYAAAALSAFIIRQDETLKNWLKHCQTEIPVGRDVKFGRDELVHHYYAQAVFHVGGETWTNYRAAMFDQLQSSQNKDGSWPAAEGLSVGPVYATALWCTVLQLDKRSHPSTRQPLEVTITSRILEPLPRPRFAMKSVGDLDYLPRMSS